jgi:hypothetical protein
MVFACNKRRVAAGIAALLAVGLISLRLKSPHLDSDSSGFGLALTLSFLLVKTIPWVPKEGDFSPIISYGIGYWLWVASATILAVGMSADIMFRQVINAPANPSV